MWWYILIKLLQTTGFRITKEHDYLILELGILELGWQSSVVHLKLLFFYFWPTFNIQKDERDCRYLAATYNSTQLLKVKIRKENIERYLKIYCMLENLSVLLCWVLKITIEKRFCNFIDIQHCLHSIGDYFLS
jgi:hypothetical protein